MSTNTGSEKSETKKEYSFIQENTVPKKRNTRRKVIRYILATIGLAILFGIVSSITFNFMNEQIANWNKKKDEITLGDEKAAVPTDEVDVSTALEKNNRGVIDDAKDVKEHRSILKDYSKMYLELNKFNKNMKRSMVSVFTVDNILSWVDFEETKESYGVVVADDIENFYILCNYKTVQDISKIEVAFKDNRRISADLRDYNTDLDIAILEVAKDKIKRTTRSEIEKISMGDSYQLSVGTPFVAMGSPNGYNNSMEIGCTTSEKIDKYIVDGKQEIFQTSMLDVKKGNGFVVDFNGNMIGFITNQFTDDFNTENMKFIGITKLKPLLLDMVNKRKYGYLGIVAQDLSEDEMEKLGVSNGIYVADVVADSPAFIAGVKNGDIITAVNGSAVPSVVNLISFLHDHQPEDKFQLTITRRLTKEYSKVTNKVKVFKVELGKKN